MKLAWLFIVVALIHSFFTCAVAAGHLSDGVQQVIEVDAECQSPTEDCVESGLCADADREHDVHAHSSCIAGKANLFAAQPISLASQPTAFVFGQSITHQPPLPPPNA